MSDGMMDVDVPTSPPDISESPPISSSLPHVIEFKNEMTKDSERNLINWRLHEAGGDKKKLQDVLYLLLSSFWTNVSQSELKKNVIDLSVKKENEKLIESLNDGEIEEWKSIIQKGEWMDLIMHPKLRKPAEKLSANRRAEQILHNADRLSTAYTQDFIGDSATKFIAHLESADEEEDMNMRTPLYAKAISVVQSSGTGKSRMLTEVGKEIFTLPICLRKSDDPGYPPGDEPVVEYFSASSKTNELSLTVHKAIACFIAAAHQIMLETLQGYKEEGHDGPQLLKHWHERMEPTGVRDDRNAFFTKVVEQANILKSKVGSYKNFTNSPARGADNKPPSGFDAIDMAEHFYKHHAEEATRKLMEFLSTILPEKKISIMYFDEAHELGVQFWIFLRLVQLQKAETKMWYAFMGTKSSISYYAPPPSQMLSMRLKSELKQLLKPYIDLGFDQRVIARSRARVSVRMGDMQTIAFISRFGRPMWGAHLPEKTQGEIIDVASWKLRNGEDFNPKNKNHVFAILSQRLCLDPAMATSEAIELADRSVAHHMRILAGFSPKGDRFYTHSPSEPVLVMASIDLLYRSKSNDLPEVLNTLSRDLCGAGLVEKGILGELGARTLLLIARDFAAPRGLHGPDLSKPVGALGFLETLFGRNIFTGSNFDNAFGNAHVNFTHWISTRDSIPEEPNEDLLANLWARGAALQCSFSQESFDLLIPFYYGSVQPDSIFDPSLLSAGLAQVKNKAAGDTQAELAIRPIGVPRDRLPYLAILMELGCESRFKENRSKIKYKVSGPLDDGKLKKYRVAHGKAAQKLNTYVENAPGQKKRKTRQDTREETREETLKTLKEEADKAQLAIESCYRYSISVRGTSPDVYGILDKANIANEFKTLLNIIMPQPLDEEDSIRQHLRPLERLADDSPHTAWMWKYGVRNEPLVDPTTEQPM